MACPPIPITPEQVAKGRRLYEQTSVPVADIAAMMGVSVRTFNARARRWGWPRRKDRVPKNEPPRTAADVPQAPVLPSFAAAAPFVPDLSSVPPSSPDAATVAARVQGAVESGLNAVAQIVARLPPSPDSSADAERAARVLASLMRTLQEVARLKLRAAPADKYDRGPADDDEFILALARRMEEFASRSADTVPDDAAGGVA